MTDLRTPRQLSETYFAAWQDGDEHTLRGLFRDDATFRGPLGSADTGAECVAGLLGMARMIERIDVRARVSDGTNVLTFFDLHVAGVDPTPTANWTHVEDGSITAVRVAFDPRGILGAG